MLFYVEHVCICFYPSPSIFKSNLNYVGQKHTERRSWCSSQATGCHGSDACLRCCDNFDWTNTLQMLMYQPTKEIEAQRKWRERDTRDALESIYRWVMPRWSTSVVQRQAWEMLTIMMVKKTQRSLGEHSRVATVATSTEPLHQKVLT